jgi:signal transduction histidine kinase
VGPGLVPLSFTILIYVYTAAAHCPWRVSLAGLAATEALLGVVWLVRPRSVGDRGTLVIDGLLMAAAWWLARRAVTEERLRIARELHDVVAHSMSIIAVQSGVGAHVLDSQPEEARKAPGRGRGHQPPGPGRDAAVAGRAPPGGRAPRQPGPGARPGRGGGAGRRGGQGRGAGRGPDRGHPAELPAGLDLSAYRIVQEALTNSLRHAGPATARVAVRYAPGKVTVEVVDDGRGGDPGDQGHGIPGMRERAALYGGTLEAGPLPGGGFRVAATLPVEEVAR